MKQKETIIIEMDIKHYYRNKNFNFEYKTQAEVKFYPQ